MSTFEVKIRSISDVKPHPGADRLDVGKIDDYVVVTQKGRFVDGDLVIYVPEQAVVPDWVLEASGFWDECEGCEGSGVTTIGDPGKPDTIVPGISPDKSPTTLPSAVEVPCTSCKGRGGSGGLAGSQGNRVKPIRLRGVFSQGILLDLSILDGLCEDCPAGEQCIHRDYWAAEGVEVGDLLEIVKYEAPIPTHLAGEVYRVEGITTYTDIENIKRFPNVLQPGEEVVISEKIHGTLAVCYFDGADLYMSSKGVSASGRGLRDLQDGEGRSLNFYWRCAQAIGVEQALRAISEQFEGVPVTLYGEAIPAQDLKYSLAPGTATMRVFDLKINGEYVSQNGFEYQMAQHGIPMVPILHRGPYSPEVLAQHTSGKTTLGGGHIREGVVVKPAVERRDETCGRVIFKSISEAYLTRKGNTTEFN